MLTFLMLAKQEVTMHTVLKANDASDRVILQQTISVLMHNNYQSCHYKRFPGTCTMTQSQIMSRVTVKGYSQHLSCACLLLRGNIEKGRRKHCLKGGWVAGDEIIERFSVEVPYSPSSYGDRETSACARTLGRFHAEITYSPTGKDGKLMATNKPLLADPEY